MRPFGVAGLEVAAAFFEKLFFVAFDRLGSEAFLELAEELRVAGDEAGVEEGGA